MKDVPIIFSAPMVRALLDGSKSMTRRLAWRLRDVGDNHYRSPTPWQRVKPGDRLWVRENLAVMGNWGVWYDASNPPAHGRFLDDLDERGRALLERYAPAEATDSGRIPSIHMPRWASRLTLIVTATKMERLADISKADKITEGATPQMPFGSIFKALHGDDIFEINPEVVALTFRVVKANVDTPEARAALIDSLVP